MQQYDIIPCLVYVLYKNCKQCGKSISLFLLKFACRFGPLLCLAVTSFVYMMIAWCQPYCESAAGLTNSPHMIFCGTVINFSSPLSFPFDVVIGYVP